jgi:hypothetical protein
MWNEAAAGEGVEVKTSTECSERKKLGDLEEKRFWGGGSRLYLEVGLL